MRNIENDCRELLAKVARMKEYRRGICRFGHCTSGAVAPGQLPPPGEAWRPAGGTRFPWVRDEHHWLRAGLVAPEEVCGIEVGGSPVRISSNIIGAPTRVFVDGVERFYEPHWADLRVPDMMLSPSPSPGQVFDIEILLQNSADRKSDVVNADFFFLIDRIEEMIFNLESFPSELAYCAEFDELKGMAGEAGERIMEEIDPETDVADDLAAVNRIRASMKDAESFTKKRMVHLVAHAHIDMNWLWPMEETIDICRRDFQTMSSLLETYGDFRFSQSQGAVYSLMETNHQQIFEEIRRLVSDGRWDVSTAVTWTENDFNLAGGESIVRQILYTREYLKKRFGKSGTVCWAPDTFGHPSSMPQILNRAGIRWYFHMRGGPGHTVYRWKGDGGSTLLVYNECYNGAVRTDRLLGLSTQLAKNYGLTEAMLVFGVGDHGGGPSRRDIENARWLDSLSTTPRICFSTPDRFFRSLEDAESARIPEVVGELNPVFEGCYTSQSETKRLNRACEQRFLDAEAGLAMLIAAGSPSARPSIEKLWLPLLFNQFHDLLCGCAVPESHRRGEREMADSQRQAESVTADALDDLTRIVTGPGGDEESGGRGAVAVWNLRGFRRSDTVSIPYDDRRTVSTVTRADGSLVPHQICDRRLWFMAENVPPFGCGIYSIHSGKGPVLESPACSQDACFETDYYQIAFDPNSGCITKLFDMEAGKHVIGGRPWLANSAGPYPYNFSNNLLSIDYEIPQQMSAWVIGPIAETKNLYEGAEFSVISEGPLMHVLEFRHRVDSISIVQQIRLYRRLRRIDFAMSVSWPGGRKKAERAPMLRVSFRPELGAQSRYSCEVPYGVVERQRDGTEYPAQRWVDISDESYGLALLNDSKYGFTARGNTVSMTCLRSSSHPDPQADGGEHEFRFAILPHPLSREGSEVFRQAVGFNSPLSAVNCAGGANGHSILSIDNNQVLVTSLKPAGDGDSIIIRLLEIAGSACRFAMSADFSVSKVQEILITEDAVISSIPSNGKGFCDGLAGYELKTYRIYLE